MSAPPKRGISFTAPSGALGTEAGPPSEIRGNDAVDADAAPMMSGQLAKRNRRRTRSAEDDPTVAPAVREDLADEQRRALGHAPRPATGTPAPLAAEGDQVLGMAGLVTHAQETVLGATALEVGPNACCT